MKTALLILSLAMSAGCAHGTAGRPLDRDQRGFTLVGASARLLLVGPAGSVHTSVDGVKTVALFVVKSTRGDDSDCVAAMRSHAATPVLAETTGVHMQVAAGQDLCAASPRGSAEVAWHANVRGSGNLWALR